MAGDGAGGDLRGLCRWLDTVPLSRPRRNIARDFSDGVLAAEVVKFFFPTMVQLHSYVPASSTEQKLANWSHLNRKVLRQLGLRVPEEVLREVVRCRPGAAERLLLRLRQKIHERQKLGTGGAGGGQDPGGRAAREEAGYLETGCGEAGGGCTPETPSAAGVTRSPQGCPQAPPGDAAVRLQLAERERALLRAQETIQILQLKVGRLEQLLRLKNLRIDDLSRRLRDPQR